MKNRNVPMGLLDVIKNGYFQQVRFLVDNEVDVDERDVERRTALMLCAFIEPENWGVGICRLLIESGAHLAYKDRYGINAFQYAVIYERLELVRVFLRAIDFDLNAVDKQGNTALHYAVKSGNANITRLIAQACLKYRLEIGKRNNEGRTAMQEAVKGNRRKCAHVLEHCELLADENNIEANIPLDLKSVDCEHEASSFKGSRRSLARPRSSIMSHRSSKSSLLCSEYSYRRSPTIYNYDSRKSVRERKQSIDIPPHEKNNKSIIRCASTTDLRNNPEYLFQMVPLDSSEGRPRRSVRARSAFVRRAEVENDMTRRANWRTEFRKLYVSFQYQCTPSYRDTALQPPEINDTSLPILDKPMTPATSEHAIDDIDKGKKPRQKSASVSRQATEENLMKGRQSAKIGSRKIGQNVGHGGKVDPSIESSNESINSATSSKKQADGKISKAGKENTVGRNSRTSSHNKVDDAQSVVSGSDDTSKLRIINE